MDSSKCLATLWRLTTAPTLRAISASPRSGLRACRTAVAMTARSASVRRQQVLALARTLAREIGIAADDQPLARIVGRRDRCHVTLVEQRHLQRPGLDQRPDGQRAQRRDPVEPGAISASRRTCVIMPRSPTSATRSSAKRFLTLSIWAASVRGSPVSPSNTSMATGQPSAAHNRP
jgi:hypothetical protein